MSQECKEGYILVGPVTIHYLEWGVGDQEVILLHGWGGDAHEWYWVARALGEEFRLIIPDLRGHGDSMKPAKYYTLADYGKDVFGLVEGLGLHQPALVGHSWGGAVALFVAATYPGTLSRVLAEDPVLNARLHNAAEVSLPRILHRKNQSPEEVFAEMKAENLSVTEEDLDRRWGAIQKFSNLALEQTLTANRDFDFETILPQVSCPTLVLVGKEALGGIIPPQEAERVRQLLGNGQVMTIEDMGHSLHRSNLERFLGLARSFLR